MLRPTSIWPSFIMIANAVPKRADIYFFYVYAVFIFPRALFCGRLSAVLGF